MHNARRQRHDRRGDSVDLEKWALISQIVSSVAILATLVYLAIQTRQSAQAILANSRSVLLSGDLAVLQQSIDNPSVASFRTKTTGHTPEEMTQLESWLVALIRTREHHWFQYRDGLLDKQTWQAYRTAIPYVLSYPVERAYWDYVKQGYFDPDFVAEIDRLLADIPVVTDLRPTIEKAIEASRARAESAH
jgi:hypothetical protein